MGGILFLLGREYINLEAKNLSDFKDQLQQMTNDELIDFALEHTGQDNEDVRSSALQEHFLRIKDEPNTVIAQPGDIEILRLQLARLQNQ